MNKDNAHLYLPLVQALADGELQEEDQVTGKWTDAPYSKFDKIAACYRRKPKPKKLYYRVGLLKNISGEMYTATVDSEVQEEDMEEFTDFIRWLGPEIEYEVTE